MYHYKITLRLGGSPMNEVVKTVTAPELLVLQFVHGTDAIADVEELKNEKINYVQEKSRLKRLYDMSLTKRDQSIDNIFGALGTVPDRIPPELLERYNIEGDIPMITDGDILALAGKKTRFKDKPASVKTPKEIEREQKVTPASEVNLADLME